MYYKMALNSFPSVCFAHVYKTDHYYMEIGHRESFIEISYVEKGSIVVRNAQGQTEAFAAPCVLTHFGGQPKIISSPEPLHCHETVGIQLDYGLQTISAAEAVDCFHNPRNEMASIISDHFPMDEYCIPVQKQIRKIIHSHSLRSERSFVQCSGLILELLAEMTAVSLRNCLIEEKRISSPGTALYCQKAMDYISARLAGKLTVREIASHLKISAGYLSGIFKEYAGCTLIEYINQRKLMRVKELITDNRMTLREAGAQLGFLDENYLSRIFKKYIGLNARNCLQLPTHKEE